MHVQWRRTEQVSEGLIHATRASLEIVKGQSKSIGHTLDVSERLTVENQALTGGIGVAHLVLGTVELAQAYAALCRGNRTQGWCDAAGGSASLVAGACLIWAAFTAAPRVGVLDVNSLSAAASGIGACAEGLEEVLERRNRAQIAAGVVKLSAGGMLLWGAMSRDAAFLAAGSLTYLGAVGVSYAARAFLPGRKS